MQKNMIVIIIHAMVTLGITIACFYEEADLSDIITYSFEKTSVTNILAYQNNNETIWTDIESPLQCARLTYKQHCRPKGFFYNDNSKKGRPVFWQPLNQRQTTPTFHPGTNDHFYQFKGRPCRSGFKDYIYTIGDEKVTTCLMQSQDPYFYTNALAFCDDQAAYIATARSTEKLALLKSIYPDLKFWVGLTDRVSQTVFKWADDGSAITQGEIDQMFETGNPWQKAGYDCVITMVTKNKLRTYYCNDKRHYVCEVGPGL